MSVAVHTTRDLTAPPVAMRQNLPKGVRDGETGDAFEKLESLDFVYAFGE